MTQLATVSSRQAPPQPSPPPAAPASLGTRFGEVPLDRDRLITFPAGLLGFADCQRYRARRPARSARWRSSCCSRSTSPSSRSWCCRSISRGPDRPGRSRAGLPRRSASIGRRWWSSPWSRCARTPGGVHFSINLKAPLLIDTAARSAASTCSRATPIRCVTTCRAPMRPEPAPAQARNRSPPGGRSRRAVSASCSRPSGSCAPAAPSSPTAAAGGCSRPRPTTRTRTICSSVGARPGSAGRRGRAPQPARARAAAARPGHARQSGRAPARPGPARRSDRAAIARRSRGRPASAPRSTAWPGRWPPPAITRPRSPRRRRRRDARPGAGRRPCAGGRAAGAAAPATMRRSRRSRARSSWRPSAHDWWRNLARVCLTALERRPGSSAPPAICSRSIPTMPKPRCIWPTRCSVRDAFGAVRALLETVPADGLIGANAQNLLGVTLARQGRIEAGLAALEAVPALAPDAAELQMNRLLHLNYDPDAHARRAAAGARSLGGALRRPAPDAPARLPARRAIPTGACGSAISRRTCAAIRSPISSPRCC